MIVEPRGYFGYSLRPCFALRPILFFFFRRLRSPFLWLTSWQFRHSGCPGGAHFWTSRLPSCPLATLQNHSTLLLLFCQELFSTIFALDSLFLVSLLRWYILQGACQTVSICVCSKFIFACEAKVRKMLIFIPFVFSTLA